MLCSFCLTYARFQRERGPGWTAPVYVCPECRELIPASYARNYRRYPPVVVSAVGFRQHGKTAYFASLFYALKKLRLPQYWPTFYTMALNEDSLETVYRNVEMLESGELPHSTPKIFPRPTILRVEDLPFFRQMDWTWLFYDTGGESFERPTQLVQFASFVGRARTVMLLISLTDLEDPAEDMHRLLNTYLVGTEELGGYTTEQHLVVVYTKVDWMGLRFSRWDLDWEEIKTYLVEGSVDGLAQLRGYIQRMRHISDRLEQFTLEELQAYEFINAIRSNFKSVVFSIVSALGAEPDQGHMPVRIVPRRILDPLLWMMVQSKRGWW